MLALVILAGLWAGLQNTLAGGGSFVTLPALIVSGMSPLSANITSTVALFPAQVTTGWASRNMVRGIGKLSLPDELLHKSIDRMTPAESHLYHQHPLRA